MKSNLIAAALLLGLTIPVSADPLLIDAPVASWDGAYIGAVGGWTNSKTTGTDVAGEEWGPPGTVLDMTDVGLIGGVAAGYNFQNGNWVFGPELELGWISNDKVYVDPTDDDDGLYTQYGFYGALTGRIGYVANNTLFYGKGGVVFANMKNAGGEFDGIGNEDSRGKWGFDGNEAGFGDETRTGLTVGAGMEHALSDNWTFKTEYMFADFGTKTYGHVDGDMSEPFDFNNHIHTVKFGLNYRF